MAMAGLPPNQDTFHSPRLGVLLSYEQQRASVALRSVELRQEEGGCVVLMRCTRLPVIKM